MDTGKKAEPTDEKLKNVNPTNRDFERTEKQTDRVSESELDEQKKEQNASVDGK